MPKKHAAFRYHRNVAPLFWKPLGSYFENPVAVEIDPKMWKSCKEERELLDHYWQETQSEFKNVLSSSSSCSNKHRLKFCIRAVSEYNTISGRSLCHRCLGPFSSRNYHTLESPIPAFGVSPELILWKMTHLLFSFFLAFTALKECNLFFENKEMLCIL